MADTYDVAIVGAGPGGYVAAIRAAQLGLKVALIEKRKTLGGTCLNIGCIPSKALLDSTEFLHRIAHQADTHGIQVAAPKVDLKAMHSRKDAIVKKLTGGVGQLMKANKVTVFEGFGRIKDANTVEVIETAEAADPLVGPDAPGEKAKVTDTVSAKNIVIATGSVPQELPFLPFDGKNVVSSSEGLAFTTVPKRLAVVGAGAIGLELGSVWARLGSEVTVVEILPEILAGWDSQLAKTARREFSKQGISFELETKVTGFEKKKGGLVLKAEKKDGSEVSYEADKILVAVGRKSYFESLNLEAVGVSLEPEGRRISVDHHFRTSVPSVYAIGDVVRGPMLAHKAEEDGVAVAEIIAGKAGHVDYRTVPNVVYTWPEVASVGSTEEALKSEGRDYRTGSFPFGPNGRAMAMEETAGFVKVLADSKTDEILGIHIVGPWASDLIGEAVTAMVFGGSSEDIARTSHPHPTLLEVIKEAALGVDGRALHKANR
jgi:dihydrolipoamide dehydrogenase